MNKYAIIASITTSYLTVVEAETVEEAVEQAKKRGMSPAMGKVGDENVDWTYSDDLGIVDDIEEVYLIDENGQWIGTPDYSA